MSSTAAAEGVSSEIIVVHVANRSQGSATYPAVASLPVYSKAALRPFASCSSAVPPGLVQKSMTGRGVPHDNCSEFSNDGQRIPLWHREFAHLLGMPTWTNTPFACLLVSQPTLRR